MHTRSIRVESFARDDDQWDLEAELLDTKCYDFPRSDGSSCHAGEPIHHIRLRVTINAEFTITAAIAAYDAAPYGPQCTAIAPDYSELVGMNLLRNFRQTVKDRYARTAGCTHLTELCFVLPTVAVQTMAKERRQNPQPAAKAKRPFQLEGCHALRIDGPVAREFYPQWYVAPKADASCK